MIWRGLYRNPAATVSGRDLPIPEPSLRDMEALEVHLPTRTEPTKTEITYAKSSHPARATHLAACLVLYLRLCLLTNRHPENPAECPSLSGI